MKKCANCGGMIGDLETPMIWRDSIVCRPCHENLTQPVPTNVRGRISPLHGAVGAGTAIILIFSTIGGYGYYQKQQTEKRREEYERAKKQVADDMHAEEEYGKLLIAGADWETVAKMRRDREDDKRHRELLDALKR